MATRPPASDLWTVRESVEAVPGFLERQGLSETSKDLRALLTTYDAQAVRLAAHQAVLERLRDRAHFSSDPYSRDYAEFIDAEMATLNGRL